MASILQRVASGDERAVSDCIDEYGGVIWSLANRYLAGKSSEAEDANPELLSATDYRFATLFTTFATRGFTLGASPHNPSKS